MTMKLLMMVLFMVMLEVEEGLEIVTLNLD